MLNRITAIIPAPLERRDTPIFVENVLPYLKRWRDENLQTVLVTLIDKEGSSPRPLGAQMAITETGGAVGHISTDCLGEAIIVEAKAVMSDGRNRLVRYGKGSKYMDIKLPCGSGLDLYFDGGYSDQLLDEVLALHNARKPSIVQTDMRNGHSTIQKWRDDRSSGRDVGDPSFFFKKILPELRLFIAGTGPTVSTLALMASQAGFQVEVGSSDETVVAQLYNELIDVRPLTPFIETVKGRIDAYSACVLLFHDHDNEPDILSKTLASNSFYIGAMGSSRTHQDRLSRMTELGFSSDQLAKIKAPIGVIQGAKSPPEMAISILAEIMNEARERGLTC